MRTLNCFLFSLFVWTNLATAQPLDWFAGLWSGTVQQVVGFPHPYQAEVEINNYTPGSIVGKTRYPGLNCGGILYLVSASASQVVLDESISYGSGNCIGDQVRLNRVSATQVNYNWYTVSGAHWIINQPLTRSEGVICGRPELRTTYSSSTPGYHFYINVSRICSPSEGTGTNACNAPNVFNLMLSKLKFIAPPTILE